LKTPLASLLLLGLLAAAPALPNLAFAQGQESGTASTPRKGPSGLPIPRFVSLKSSRVNVRKGPSTEHAVAWVFSQAGLPIEVISEFENWRQVRDSEGSEGWVFHALLSGRRTGVIMPWVKEKQEVALHNGRSASSAVVARVETGVLGTLVSCDGEWCEFTVNGYSGFIEQERLWGVYRGELIN